MGKSTKAIACGETSKFVIILLPQYACLFPIRFLCLGYFIKWEMDGFSHCFPKAWKRWQTPSNVESLENWFVCSFYQYECFFHQIPILWYTSSYGKWTSFLIIFPCHGKVGKTARMEEAWETGLYAVSTVWLFFPLDFDPVVYFIIQEMHGFSHHFPISWKRQQNHSNGESLGNQFPHFFHSMIAFYHQIPILWYTSSYGKCMGFPFNFSTKSFVQGKTWEIGTHIFSIFALYGCFLFHQIPISWHISSLRKCMGIPINLSWHKKIQQIGRAQKIGTYTFPKVWVHFFHQIHTLWYTLPHGKRIFFL